MTRRHMFWLWLPLAVSFTLMMMEGPVVQSSISRLGNPALNLAAFGLVLSISLIIESPVIMLISTAIALARDAQSYRALRTFVIGLNVLLTVVTAIVAWTPVYDLVVSSVLGIPSPISDAARPALRIMLLWTAAIGWRRFYQGILVRHGRSTLVSYGTAVRLASSIGVAVWLVMSGNVPGAQVGAYSLMAGVLSEALVTYLFAVPLVRSVYIAAESATHPPLTLSMILGFHLPLAATSLLTLVAQPMTAAALARLAFPETTLAAWPVVFSSLLVLRGWGMALQETTIAQGSRVEAQQPLRDFTLIVAGVTTFATALLAFTPLLDVHLRVVMSLEPELWASVRLGIQMLLLLPALTALTSWLRGLLVAASAPASVYIGMAVNLAINGALLLGGVLLNLPGIPVAGVALMAASGIEYIYLQRRYTALKSRESAQGVAAAPLAS